MIVDSHCHLDDTNLYNQLDDGGTIKIIYDESKSNMRPYFYIVK